jgi:hypothetical protein
MASSPLQTLAQYLAGEFANPAQAAESPAWYVHLKLWQRPIPSLSNEHTYSLFLEQVSVDSGKPPYRQRILRLSEQTAEEASSPDQQPQLHGQYFALAEPAKFIGAAEAPHRLEALRLEDLITLPNSQALIQTQTLSQGGYQFCAALPEGQLCSFEYGGQPRYVYLGFDVTQTSPTAPVELSVHDKGIDPDTGKGLWGALMGPFKMVKYESFSW